MKAFLRLRLSESWTGVDVPIDGREITLPVLYAAIREHVTALLADDEMLFTALYGELTAGPWELLPQGPAPAGEDGSPVVEGARRMLGGLESLLPAAQATVPPVSVSAESSPPGCGATAGWSTSPSPNALPLTENCNPELEGDSRKAATAE